MVAISGALEPFAVLEGHGSHLHKTAGPVPSHIVAFFSKVSGHSS